VKLSGTRARPAASPSLLLAVLLAAAGERGNAAARPVVVTTTTMLADAAGTLLGDAFDVRSLVPAGADPHLYRPTPSDARAVASAAVVVLSGHGLEGWMGDLASATRGVVVDAGASVPPLRDEGAHGAYDPHYWHDPVLWQVAVGALEVELARVFPAHAAGVRDRGQAYRATLGRLDAWAAEQIDTIPSQQRVLVTSHDAFRYFGARYGLQVRGLVGISTESEASQSDVAATIDLIRAERVPAVFVETSVNPALIERVARETGVTRAGPLYADSLGAAGDPGATYVTMFAENVRMVVEGLGGTWTAFSQ